MRKTKDGQTRMNASEWKNKYNITDEEFDLIKSALNTFNGMVTDAEHPRVDYKGYKVVFDLIGTRWHCDKCVDI